jgi:xylose isomerase
VHLLGKLRDRFCEYGKDFTLTERLEQVARIPELAGVEIIYPRDLSTLEGLAATLKRLKLSVAAVNVNIKADPDFAAGALTSPDEKVRQKAVSYIRRGKDCAVALGASRVTCCPLVDGHDYAFQSHYGAAWDRMKESIKEGASYLPEVTLCLEFKPSEARVYNMLNSASKAILMCQMADAPNVGINVDTGHSTLGGESPAQALMLVKASGLPLYIHTNDNNGKGDWDLVAGACNVWEYLEFLFYLKEIGYDDWITSDAVPFRLNPVEFFTLNARFTARLWNWLDEVDRDEIHQRLLRNDFFGLRKMLDPYMFSFEPVAVPGHARP